jgi:hypothetical protein
VVRVVVVVVALVAGSAHADVQRTVAGSLQLDYLAVPTDSNAGTYTMDGATVEASLAMSVDLSKYASTTVKACFGCHGFEDASAFVDLRAADELRFRIGRMTPAFGSFPERADPASHRTADAPLPYDMGRMLRKDAWNEGVLPAPWVDNGVEVAGTHFFDGGRIDYAAYALSGPKSDALRPTDFDFVLSHSSYYSDNNSQPIAGARFSGTVEADDFTLTMGASGMAGHYDPQRRLLFEILGADIVAKIASVHVRAEYVVRRTQMDVTALPPMAAGDTFMKHGFYVETEVPIGPVDLIGRFDGLRRSGPVPIDSPLTARASLYRYTLAGALRVTANVRIESSVEYYQFSDFADEVAIHLGVATPF